MKKILLPLMLVIFLSSCSKDEEALSTEKTTGISYKSPELDFYGLEKKSLTNIQVGDMIQVNFEISKLTGAEIIEINPISKATSFHELLNTDYELYIPSSTEKDKYTKVNTLKMKLGITTFYIKPLVPGTFQLRFEEPKKAFDVFFPIVFSAVKINTRIEGNRDGNCGLSRWYRHNYWFSIDSGNQLFDLLFNAEGATYTYETKYRGASKTHTFTPGTQKEIVGEASKCGSYPDVNTNIESITIYKTIGGGKQEVATYYNIPINN